MIYRSIYSNMSLKTKFLLSMMFIIVNVTVSSAQTTTPVIQSEQKTLVIGSEQNFPPFATGMTDSTAGGFTVDFWKAVAAEVGLKYTLRVLPFRQVLQEFQEGKIDVLINLAISDERRNFADFSVPHVIVHGAVFVRKDKTDVQSEDDLSGQSIIVLNADLAHDYAISKGWIKQLVLVDTVEKGLKLLASGKHDAMLLSKLVGMQSLQILGLTNIKSLKIPAGFSQKFAFAVPKGQAGLLSHINEAMAITKTNGIYTSLYDKWFGIYEVKELSLHELSTYISLFILLILAISGYFYYQRKIERKQAESREKSRSHILELIALGDPLPVILEAIVRGVEQDNSSMLCSILLLDDAGKHLLFGAAPSLPDFYNKAIHGMEIGAGFGSCGTAAYTNERVIVVDIQIHPYWTSYKALADKAGLRGCWSEPIRSTQGDVLGTFAIYHRDVHQPTEANIALIEQTASLASIAIEKTKTELTLQASEERWAFAIEGAGDGVWDWNVVTDDVFFSVRFKEILGYSESEFVNKFDDWGKQLHPDDKKLAYEDVKRCFNRETLIYKNQHRLLCKDGSYKWVLARGKVVSWTDDNKPLRMIGTHTDITVQKQADFELHQAHTQYLNLVENIGDKFVIYSHLAQEGCITYVSDSFEDVFGLKKDDIIGKSWGEKINWLPEDIEATEAIVKQQIEGKLDFYQFRMSFIHPDLTLRTLQVSNHPVRDDLGEVISIDGIVEDITERTQSEEKLKLAASVFANAREGILITDAAGIIIEVNETFSLITGYSREEIIGQNPRILQSGLQSPEFYNLMWKSLLENEHWYGEVWNRHKSGEFYAELLTISAIQNAAGQVQNYVALFSDITLMKKHQGQLEHIVHFDVLTSLPNRVLLADRLNQAIARSQRGHNSLAVVFLDLDKFKEVNDTHGHNVGDELLIIVSKLMKDALREGDTLARIGGDEFVAVLPDLDKSEDYQQVLERLLLAASMPIKIGEIELQVSASIGVTLYPQDGADADILIRHADQAMYLAKQAGKNCYHLFDTEHDDAVNFRQESINNISAALDRDEFVLHYQPKVNMVTGKVVGVEALIRWQHPARSLVQPMDFLPIIENHAISLDIGEWVIDTALSQISQWQKMGFTLPVSINISAYQLQQSNFVTRLTALLAGHKDVSPNDLELEVLETSALDDVHHVSTIMNACIALGVNFALDDFGTGYSSLTHLRRLPAHLIKIDQTFVRDMLIDVDDLAIIEGVIALAKSFKRDVIAEGVETIDHGTALLHLGCELAQGYGIAKPMPASDVPTWIENWQPDASWRI